MRQAYLKTLGIFRLLFVYYSEAKVNLVCLFKVGLDLHNLGEGFLGIVVAAIAVVEDANAVPEHGVLGIAEIDQSLLVSVVSLLEIFGHEEAVAC